MKKFRSLLLVTAAAAICVPAAMAQTATTTTTPKQTVNQRKDNQQDRIGEGVENGSLTAGEATHLEKKESSLNKEEHHMRAEGNGKLTAADRAKLNRQQNHLSNQIYKQKHDAQAQNVNPKSEVGQRQRNQQQRIGEGIENGSMTAGEAARAERHEAGMNKEISGMRQANGGKLTNGEKSFVNHQQNRNSRGIYRQKHNPRHQRS